MKRKWIWLFAMVGVVALVGLAGASNMGFKLNKSLTTNTANNNVNWTSLPYFNNYSLAEDIAVDSNGDCGAGTITSIQKFDTATNTFTTHGAGTTKNNFAITTGAAYGVEVSAACTTWVIVGSHDDSYDPGGVNSVSLVTNAANNNVNWVSVPYHTTSSVAENLCTEVGTNATSVIRFDTATNAFATHGCGTTKNNFALTAGEGVEIEVSAAATWQPSHY